MYSVNNTKQLRICVKQINWDAWYNNNNTNLLIYANVLGFNLFSSKYLKYLPLLNN